MKGVLPSRRIRSGKERAHMGIPFAKLQGAGNGYVVIDAMRTGSSMQLRKNG
jgi:hypothetical protein